MLRRTPPGVPERRQRAARQLDSPSILDASASRKCRGPASCHHTPAGPEPGGDGSRWTPSDPSCRVPPVAKETGVAPTRRHTRTSCFRSLRISRQFRIPPKRVSGEALKDPICTCVKRRSRGREGLVRGAAPEKRKCCRAVLVALAAACLAAFMIVPAATGATASGPVVVGTQTVEGTDDPNNDGVAEAFRTTASGTGTVSALQLYLSSARARPGFRPGSTPTRVVIRARCWGGVLRARMAAGTRCRFLPR